MALNHNDTSVYDVIIQLICNESLVCVHEENKSFKVFLLASKENCGQLEGKLLIIIAQTLREKIHCLSHSM